MQRIRQIGTMLTLAGFLLFLPCGGMRIKGDPEGTWLFIGPLQWIGGGVILLGLVFSLVGNFQTNQGKNQE